MPQTTIEQLSGHFYPGCAKAAKLGADKLHDQPCICVVRVGALCALARECRKTIAVQVLRGLEFKLRVRKAASFASNDAKGRSLCATPAPRMGEQIACERATANGIAVELPST